MSVSVLGDVMLLFTFILLVVAYLTFGLGFMVGRITRKNTLIGVLLLIWGTITLYVVQLVPFIISFLLGVLVSKKD